jgi:hypothetical protein
LTNYSENAMALDADTRFDGDDYVPERDNDRLIRQYERIFSLMRDGVWRGLREIESKTNDPPASISAQLRHMRKRRFGAHTIDRRYLGEGLYEYRLIVNVEGLGANGHKGERQKRRGKEQLPSWAEWFTRK